MNILCAQRVPTLVVTLTIAVTVCAGDVAADTPTQLELAPPTGFSHVRKSDIAAKGFPAISADAKEIAIFHSNDDTEDSALIDIVRIAGRKRLRTFQLLSKEENRITLDDPLLRAELSGRMTAPNDYLLRKSFVAMQPLYQLVNEDTQDIVNAGKRIHYDDESLDFKELTISSAADGRVQLRIRLPFTAITTPDGEHTTWIRSVPNAGWIDGRSRTVVLRIERVASDESMFADEWLVRTLR